MRLRRSEREDAPAVADVFLPAFRSLTFLPIVHGDDETREWVANWLVPETELWVAEEDDRVVGFIAFTDDVLGWIYVHPDKQNRGVGSALLDLAKGLRPHGFELWVFQQNEGARRFYERHGFECVELTDGSGNEERTPDARYVWRPS